MIRRVLPLVVIALALGCGKKDSPTSPTPGTKSINVTGDLNFGDVQLGSTQERSFRIVNTGSDTLTVSRLTATSTAGFSVSWSSGTLAPNVGQDVKVFFAPTEAKSYSGTLRVEADHTSGTNTIPITAVGTVAGLKFPLTGSVSESIPTTNVKIANATVTIDSGPNAGRTAVTDGAGNYSFSDLTAGGMNLKVAAPGYQQGGGTVDLNGPNKTLNLTMRPDARTIDETITGSVGGGDSTCSDGTFQKPCKRHTLPIHNAGLVEVDMEFTGGSNDLDLTFWSSGTLVAESKGVRGRESISANVSGGGSYEVRVTYYSGATVSNYTLRVRRPN